jgi:hypothetical protein
MVTARSATVLSISTIVKREKAPRREFDLGSCADQHLHPGDDADGGLLVAQQLVPRELDTPEIVDQDVGVEERPHHSRRARS